MVRYRSAVKIVRAQEATEGAGVRIRRSLGTSALDYHDPFLLLDEFKSVEGSDYIAGFPDHPHRGFETVTYMLAGSMRHEDHKGNRGELGPGSVQWMTAGRGIIHSEMPLQKDGLLWGFQLWVNLPARSKMIAPRYQDIPASAIPEVKTGEGVVIRVMAGEARGTRGPVEGIVTSPVYLDVSVPPGRKKRLTVDTRANAFAYVFEGEGTFRDASDPTGVLTERHVEDDNPVRSTAGNRTLVTFGGGDEVVVQAGEQGVRFLLVSGRPIEEPVAWYGPIVMNTKEELQVAINDLRQGTFIRNR